MVVDSSLISVHEMQLLHSITPDPAFQTPWQSTNMIISPLHLPWQCRVYDISNSNHARLITDVEIEPLTLYRLDLNIHGGLSRNLRAYNAALYSHACEIPSTAICVMNLHLQGAASACSCNFPSRTSVRLGTGVPPLHSTIHGQLDCMLRT